MDGNTIATLVLGTSRPARIDSYDNVAGSIAIRVREVGVSAAVGEPIIVDRRVWGMAGEPRNRRTLVAFEQPGPAPDGLTIDDRGDIWVAVYGGWAVRHYSPAG